MRIATSEESVHATTATHSKYACCRGGPVSRGGIHKPATIPATQIQERVIGNESCGVKNRPRPARRVLSVRQTGAARMMSATTIAIMGAATSNPGLPRRSAGAVISCNQEMLSGTHRSAVVTAAPKPAPITIGPAHSTHRIATTWGRLAPSAANRRTRRRASSPPIPAAVTKDAAPARPSVPHRPASTDPMPSRFRKARPTEDESSLVSSSPKRSADRICVRSTVPLAGRTYTRGSVADSKPSIPIV
ncbi:hypothetical protein DFJ65_1019 [Calidifontibacter indicus]|uniref:Uncharacterized protein n=1 Tax=Calidifontibacter indicus TaxID=419650 RepID=A0A3D9UKN5_9MICO|nr:hypothetical protein DFJ65_1019 [Calidifontibacter indicus]